MKKLKKVSEYADRRIKNFGINSEYSRYPDFEGERDISITYNGRQFTTFNISPSEAQQLVNLLKKVFSEYGVN